MPWEKVLWAVLIAVIVYRWVPRDESRLLVLVEAEDTLSHRCWPTFQENCSFLRRLSSIFLSHRYRMKKLGNVASIFKVDRNLDFHLRIDDEAASEAKVRNTDSFMSLLLLEVDAGIYCLG